MAIFSEVDRKALVKSAMTAAGGVGGKMVLDWVEKQAQTNPEGAWQAWVINNAALAQTALGFGVYALGRKQKGIRTISESLGMGMMVSGLYEYLNDHVRISGPMGAFVPNSYLPPNTGPTALASPSGSLGAFTESYSGTPHASKRLL